MTVCASALSFTNKRQAVVATATANGPCGVLGEGMGGYKKLNCPAASAADIGYLEAEHLVKDPDLKPLHAREGWMPLVAQRRHAR